MRQTTGYSQWYVDATSAVAREADRALRNTGCAPHFLYYKPHGLAFCVVVDEGEVPDGYVLVTNERIPGNLTIDHLTRWVRKYTGSVPVLPGD